MQASQWTTDIIVLTAVLALGSALLGYFAAALRQGKQAGQLAAQLEQALQAQASAIADQASLAEQLKSAQTSSNELQVAESGLSARLQSTIENMERLRAEQQENKDVSATLQLKLEDASRQHYETAKRLETAQAERRALLEQVTDLRDRLAAAQTSMHSLNGERDALKAELANVDASAKVAATGEREARELLAELRQKLADQVQQYNELLGRYQPLSNQHAELNTSLQKREELVAELRDRLGQTQATNEQLHADRDRLKDELAIEGKRAQSLETSERDVREQLSEAKLALTERAQANNALQERLSALSSEYTELKTTLQKREEHFQEQMLQLADTRKSLTQEFENLANKIFEEKGKTFTRRARLVSMACSSRSAIRSKGSKSASMMFTMRLCKATPASMQRLRRCWILV